MRRYLSNVHARAVGAQDGSVRRLSREREERGLGRSSMRNCYNAEEQRKGKRRADDAEHEKRWRLETRSVKRWS